MKVSPFTPLFFIDRKADGEECSYRQTFAVGDVITLEVLAEPEESVVAYVYNACTGKRLAAPLTFKVWRMNSGMSVHFSQTTLGKGVYYIEILGYGRCEIFEVTDDESVLQDTTLIQYTMKDNRQRIDAVFLYQDEPIIFSFRVPGGFRDSDWAFSVDSEQYFNEYSNIVQLWALESTSKKFRLGNGEGVPVWYGELLNRLLVCTYVWFDGEQYVRKDGNTPEMEQLQEGVNSFVFTQTVQKAVNIDVLGLDGTVYLRRIDGKEDYRVTDEGDDIRVTIY